MCARVSLSKLLETSIRKSYSTGLVRNKNSRFNSREGIPKEWTSSTAFYDYPVNPIIGSVQKQIVNALHLGEREKASTLLSNISHGKHVLLANHFAVILEYCALTPDPLFVMEIWKTMEEKGIDLNNKCHTLMIRALCKAGYLEEAFNLMSNCGETSFLYPTLQKYNILLRASTGMNSVIHVSKCLDLMENGMLGKDEITYIEPSRGAYDGLIRVLVKKRGFHDGIEMLNLMKQKNLKPHDSTFAAISVGCSESMELDLAEAFLYQMAQSKSIYPYNKLLEACDTMDQPERGVHVFGKMKQLKVAPNIKTYELLFSLFGNVNAPYENGNILSQAEATRRINAIEDDMVRNGIQHSYESLRNLLRALGSEGMISGLLHYLRVAENQFAPGTPIYNIVLHSLIEAKEDQTAINVFKTLMSHGYRPNDVTCNIMIDCCSFSRSFKSAQGLIAMMIRCGYPPQTQTYTSLVKLVLALEDFDEALILLNQACSEGIELDAVLFNTIIKVASQKDRIDIIEYVMDCMHKEGVPPDPATCGHVFTAYVNKGFYNTAMEALQVMSIHMLSEEDINKNKAVFEELIYAEDSEAESRALDLFKDSKENLSVALLNLRWCAMVGNPISWLTNQSQWVKRLSATNSFR